MKAALTGAAAHPDNFWYPIGLGAEEAIKDAIRRGWLAEVPDAPAAPDPAAGWRPIHEAYGRTDFLCVGGWFMDEWCWSRHDYTQAVTYGYTHFMDLPYPERKP
jgi:hypothetical protein